MTSGVKALLQKYGLRATPHRVALLERLLNAPRPLSVSELHTKLSGADLATVYRLLDSLVRVGIAAKVEISGDEHARFEIAHGHHHHLVCQECGIVEDVNVCNIKGIERSIEKTSRRFKSIYAHDLEFLGVCLACAQ